MQGEFLVIVKKLSKERKVSLTLYSILIMVWFTFSYDNLTFEMLKNNISAPITMVFGSFLGGFTCEGGGAIAFPVFTKLLKIDPGVVRDFSFAIQSIGMTFGSITIITKKINVEVNVIIHAVLGGIVGIVLGTFFVVPILSSAIVKLTFTVVLCAFGISLFLKNFIFKSNEYTKIQNFSNKDRIILLTVGLVGGIFSSLMGTGIHFITFSFVIMYYRINEKVATPTSIIIMASDSIFGFIFRLFIIRTFSSQALLLWQLCIPVVALFAPLGALACSKVSRMFIVKFLLFLISCEVISTFIVLEVSSDVWIMAGLILIITLFFYLLLIKLSNKRIVANNVLE